MRIWKKMLSVALVIVVLICLAPTSGFLGFDMFRFSASAISAPSSTTVISERMASVTSGTYGVGKYFRDNQSKACYFAGTTSKCHSNHGGTYATNDSYCNCKVATSDIAGTTGGIQCFGYARYVFYQLFGLPISTQIASGNYALSSTNNTTTVGKCLEEATASIVSSIFSSAKMGDFIQARTSSGGMHSMIVYSVSSSQVTVLECNHEAQCYIGKRNISWNSFASEYPKFTVYRSSNYPNSSTVKPGTPVLSVSDKNTSDKDVTFTWNRTANTDHYDLRIYNHGNYNVGAPYYKFGMSASTTSTTMKFPAGKYAAYITAVSSSGEEAASEWITTFDVVDPPGKSVLTATPGKMVTDGVSFTWTKAANAATYDLRVYNYGDYNVGAPYYKFGMSANTTSATIKLPVGKYSAYIATIASNGASEGGDSAWITFTVSEPPINSNYPTNIKGYKMWKGATATQAYDTQTLSGYYLDDNEITVVAIYTNDWAKIKHTVNGTEKTAYVPLGGLINEKSKVEEKYCNAEATVFTRYTCETKQSTLPKDSKVLIIGTYKTDLTQICYLKNGTYYIGWISNDLISDQMHTHSYTAKVTKAATCTASGTKTYTCICGENYTETIPALGHKAVTDEAITATCYSSGLTEGKHCSTCGTVLVAQKVTPITSHKDSDNNGNCDYCDEDLVEEEEDKDKNCSCNCHKSGFMGFIWKILNFFYKIFRTNKICACGVAHY